MTRRTISLPERLARKLDTFAKSERMSFSSAVTALLQEALVRRETPYFKSLGVSDDGPGDLSVRTEKYLRETAQEWKITD